MFLRRVFTYVLRKERFFLCLIGWCAPQLSFPAFDTPTVELNRVFDPFPYLLA